MKKTLIALFVLLMAVGLFAQGNSPRVLYVRLVDSVGAPLTNTITGGGTAGQTTTDGITFVATLLNGSAEPKTNLSLDFGYYFAGGNLYAKVQLGNFSEQWAMGNVLTVDVTRASDGATGLADNIVIPDNGTGTIWWGRPGAYPGAPISLVAEVLDFPLDITANYPGAAILYSADDTVYAPTGEVAPHLFAAGDAAAGWYKMGDLAGVVWTNNPYHFENTADAAFRFLGTKTPGFAINPLPADGATIEWPWDAPATGDVVLSWDPIVGVTGYNVYWNGAEIPVPVVDPTWTAEGLAVGEYTWKVVPYITDPVKGTVNLQPVKAKINDRSASVKGTPNPADAPVWGFEIVRLPKPPIDPENPPVGIDVVEDIPVTTMPGTDSGIPAVTYGITATGVWDVIVTKPAGYGYPWYAFLNVIGGGSYASGPIAIDTYTFVGVDFGDAKGDAELILDDNEDITLPVELSSFNAVLTAQYFVKLTWISQSETNLNGYRVYRSEGNELVSATMITPIIISATNTSSTQVYSIEDREVAFGNTYWYWLESVENDGSSNFHGPTSVFVEGEVPPVLPQATTMRSAYPNPFKAASTTTIEVAVKEGESGTLTIYNVLGQVVKTYSLNQGIHNLKWNGKDSKGNLCSSGIYFYKLSSPTMNQTKKMVIVK